MLQSYAVNMLADSYLNGSAIKPPGPVIGDTVALSFRLPLATPMLQESRAPAPSHRNCSRRPANSGQGGSSVPVRHSDTLFNRSACPQYRNSAAEIADQIGILRS